MELTFLQEQKELRMIKLIFQFSSLAIEGQQKLLPYQPNEYFN